MIIPRTHKDEVGGRQETQKVKSVKSPLNNTQRDTSCTSSSIYVPQTDQCESQQFAVSIQHARLTRLIKH